MPELLKYYKEQETKYLALSIPAWIILTLLFIGIESLLSAGIPVLLTNSAIPTKYSVLSSWLNNSNTQIFAEELVKWLLTFVTPAGIVTVSYFHILKVVDTKCWKRKYPEYDISGEWQDITTYTQCLDSDGWIDRYPEKTAVSTVIFDQTCRKIEILPSDGEGFAWQSIAVHWDYQKELHILYQVRYTNIMQQKGFPASRTGYERMHIDKTGLPRNQKPNIMRGQFWHCIALDGKPMYLGDVKYERVEV